MDRPMNSRPSGYRSLDVPEQTLSGQPEMKPTPGWTSLVDTGSFLFALRMAVLLTIGSLFVLVRMPGEEGYPQGMWVLVTMLFVSWFPRLDAASVIEKSTQRLMGTLVGASLGLLCGFASTAFKHHAAQATFLGVCMFTITFLVVFSSGNFRIGQGKKIMQRFGYATILCLLTFFIAMLPFSSDTQPKWRKGVWRVLNVITGCILGTVGSVILFPRSTTSIMREKVDKQVRLAGESSQAVLHAAADAFSGHLNPLALTDELLETPAHRRDRMRMSMCRRSFRNVNKSVVTEDGDRPLTMYANAISDWKEAKALYPVMPFDPFHWFSVHISEVEKEEFKLKTARILAQALRIQTMIVSLDAIIRNDLPGYNFDDEHIEFFAEVGTSIRNMLTVPYDESINAQAAARVAEKLPEIRSNIRQISSKVCRGETGAESIGTESVESPAAKAHKRMYTPVFESIFQSVSVSESSANGEEGQRDSACEAPVFPCTASCVLLFLQLVEQVMLRSLRLHHTWTKAAKQMEDFDPHSA